MERILSDIHGKLPVSEPMLLLAWKTNENEKDRTNLYITNIPKAWTTKDSDKLKEVFEKFGHIQSAFVMVEKSTNKSNGVGFVRFANESDALATIDSLKSNPMIINGCDQPVEAKFADKHNPETRRRKNQSVTGTQLFASPLLGSALGFGPPSMSTFGSMVSPVATALSLGSLPANSGASSSLLHATMGLATAASPCSDTTSLLQRAQNGATSFANINNPVAASPSLDQFSGLNFSASKFSLISLRLVWDLLGKKFEVVIVIREKTEFIYYGLYNNQYLRNAQPAVIPQNTTWSQSPMLAEAVMAALSNGGVTMKPGQSTFMGQSNPYSLQAAYQSLLTNAGSQGQCSAALYSKNPYNTNSCSGASASTSSNSSNATYTGLQGAGTPTPLTTEGMIYYQY
ncbi:hypothetical protein Ciccas_003159, partial [Cichlidogyrus casuarinus]